MKTLNSLALTILAVSAAVSVITPPNFANAQAAPSKFTCVDGSRPSVRSDIEYPAHNGHPALKITADHCADTVFSKAINNGAILIEIADFRNDVRFSLNDRIVEVTSRLGVLPPNHTGRIDLSYMISPRTAAPAIVLTSPVATRLVTSVTSPGCAGNFEIFNEPPAVGGIGVSGRDVAYVDFKFLDACSAQGRQRPTISNTTIPEAKMTDTNINGPF